MQLKIRKGRLGTLLVLFCTLNLFLGVLLLDRGIIISGIPLASVRSFSLPMCLSPADSQQQPQQQQQQQEQLARQLPITSSFSVAQHLAHSATIEMNRFLPSAYQLNLTDMQVLDFSDNLLSTYTPEIGDDATETNEGARLVSLRVRGSLLGDSSVSTEIPIKLLVDNSKTTTPSTAPQNLLILDPPLINNQQLQHANTPLVSIVYVTNRPGSFDFLLYSLAQQTDTRYELIVVDELAPFRSAGVKELAQRLGVPLKVHIPGKPKSRELRYGITNGINTGLIFAEGTAVAVVMDFAWLPAQFVERILKFYATHPAESLLGFPEVKLAVREDLIDPAKSEDKAAVSIFSEDVTAAPLSAGWDVSLGPFPKEFTTERDAFLPQAGYWELYCAAFPRSLIKELNGIDEELDRGHDLHETWIRLRAEKLGYQVFLDHGSLIQTVDHYHFGKGRKLASRMVNGVPHIGVDEKGENRKPTLWWRGALEENSNYKRFPIMMEKFYDGIQPARAANDFDLKDENQMVALRTVIEGIDYSALPLETKYPLTLQSALNPSRLAYATLVLTPDYVVAAVGLALSLRADRINTRKDIDVVVLVGCELTQVQRAALEAVYTTLHDVAPIANPMKDKELSDTLDFFSDKEKKFWQDRFPIPSMNLVYTKLHLWALTEYKKIVFFDADTMVLKNVDELFDRPELSAAPDILPPDSFNSGVMVLEPSEKRYCDLLQKMKEIPSYDGTDQGFLNNYFNGWFTDGTRRLPTIYNTMTSSKTIYFPSYYRNQKRTRVLHFTPKKPWKDLPPSQDEMLKEEHAMWWNTLYQEFHTTPQEAKQVLYAFFVHNLPQEAEKFLTGTTM